MKKLFIIGLKDVRIIFRDRAALIFMLLAPFILTLAMGLVTGSFWIGSSSGISDIPVVIVNQDTGQLGIALVDVFKSEELAGLLEPTEILEPSQGRQLVDEDDAAAAVIIPAGFTDSIIPAAGNLNQQGQPVTGAIVKIEIYANPLRPTSVGVVKAIVDEFINRVEVVRISGTTAITQMLASGLISPQDAQKTGELFGKEQGRNLENGVSILLKTTLGETQEPVKVNVLSILAPGMALLFLMYTTTNGGRSILSERAMGTLPRLLVAPTSSSQVLGGKAIGIYLAGVAQVSILILASALLFQLRWGDPLAVVVLILATVFGASGWGMLVASVCRTPGQVASIGTALMLTFGILGGSFIAIEGMPPLVQALSRLTPNSWGLDGFTTLALGGSLTDILPNVLALLVMGVVLFTIAVLVFSRKGLVER
jgi:ABC-2 type transport system permease protein